MNTNYNTNPFSVERLCTRKTFLRLWFNPNRRENNLKEIQKFLVDAETKAKELNVKEWCVEPDFSEGDADNSSESYFLATGYVDETDSEYKRRIEGLKIRANNEFENWEKREKYYKSGALEELKIKYDAVLKSLPAVKECH